MASTDGSHEVKAARKRLASARAQKSSAVKMIDSANSMADMAREMAKTAKENKEEAQSLLRRSQGEVEDAEAFLKEAEKRWKVIEVVDSDGENENAGRRNKKRKGAQAFAAVVRPTAAAGASAAGTATSVEEIVVEGAGTPEVNGTYRRCRTDGSDALPFGYDSDYPVYSKVGLWKGRAVNFFIYRSIFNCWSINCQAGNHNDYFYWNKTLGNNLPPKAGWAPRSNGTHPAPQLQW